MKMSYEMNFEMYVGKKEQRADVLRVAKNALIANGYEEFADNFLFFHVSVFFARPAPFFNVQAFSHAVKSRFPYFPNHCGKRAQFQKLRSSRISGIS